MPERNLAIVDTYEARSLRYQARAPGRGIEHVFGHLRSDLSGKIGTDAGNESGHNDSPCLHDKRRRWARKPVRRGGAPINGSIHEEKFAILPVLGKGFIGGRWIVYERFLRCGMRRRERCCSRRKYFANPRSLAFLILALLIGVKTE